MCGGALPGAGSAPAPRPRRARTAPVPPPHAAAVESRSGFILFTAAGAAAASRVVASAHKQYRARRHVVHVENLPLCYPCLFDTIYLLASS